MYESTLNPSNKKSLFAELKVVHHFLDQNYELFFHRYKSYGVEIDLVLLSPENTIAFVEVKILSDINRLLYRLNKKQRGRLFRAKLFFESENNLATEVVLATVSAEGIHEFIVG